MNNTSRFLFKGYEYSSQKAEIAFFYELHHASEVFHFTNTLTFPHPFPSIREDTLKPFLNALLLILGISYWKLFCPPLIEIAPFTLTKDQADFWNTVYTKGLGEFFYKNTIDFRGLVQFPFQKDAQPDEPIVISRQNRSLVPIGGGKDGIVVAELLKKFAKPFTTLLIYKGIAASTAQEAVATQIGKEVIRIYNNIDPQLKELNRRKDTYNGHIPTGAIHACIALLTAYVYDYQYIVLANEESANYGNVEYLGEMMNHQWSKSVEFEELFHKYSTKYIIKNIHYFSLLRPFSEIKIAQIFSQFPQYFSHFVSCNKGYTLAQQGQTHWCGECPKCAFVFALLTAFLSRETVVHIFGKNLFDDESLLPIYKELLGVEAFKPFECVGTPEEVRYAFFKAYQKGEWNDTVIMQFFITEIAPHMGNSEEMEKKLLAHAHHHIPDEFSEIITL